MASENTANKTDISPGIQTLTSVVDALPKEGRDAGRWCRIFTKKGVHPFDDIEWKIVDARISKPDGTVVFEQKNIEVPSWWNQTTINIVADKYFRMINGVREHSVKQVFSRVARRLTEWAKEQNYFNNDQDAEVYESELIYALLHQYGAFNSPVWFNIGVPNRRQAASACFISGVDDSLDDIMKFQASETRIFAGGSGSGANLSKIRSSYERLSSGAYTSGPLSWMEALDKYAKAMKSGGSTRNAAKMVVLDMEHPDILECKDGRPGFIPCKAVEEKRAHALIDAGYTGSYDDPNSAYKWVGYQNANHSVSIPDAFMEAVEEDGIWETKERLTGNTVTKYRARDLWSEIAQAAWVCGDPGIQFSDTINRWHTTPNEGPITASNPCSEFLHVDNTACNLCAVNLTKFYDGNDFNYERYQHAIRLFVTAQNAIIAKADYPTDEITHNSHRLRPIGLNYGNLGALLMRLGYSYDSNEGRAIAARLASLMTGNAYLVSAKLAARVGAFEAFEDNKQEMLEVMRMHQQANEDISNRWEINENDPFDDDVISESKDLWREVIKLGDKFGYSISQATLQAPLGTIGFLMGMDTTGIEPAFSLISYKSLVGGGSQVLVNGIVSQALRGLGYTDDQVNEITSYMTEAPDGSDFPRGHLEGAPNFKDEHLPVFDCAMATGPSQRCLSPMAHLKMMAAIQPLITCAQSKTVNLDNNVTPDEIADVYFESWKLGVKCVALYRDGCKRSQPLSTKAESPEEMVKEIIKEVAITKRRVMPVDVKGFRHRFDIIGHRGYIIVNEYPDGTPGEVFLKLGKNGSTVGGLIDGFTQLLSIALQYGVPLKKIIRSFVNTKFEPSGMTQNPDIRFTQSLYDYLFKYLDIKYFDGQVSNIRPSSIEINDDEESSPPPPLEDLGKIERSLSISPPPSMSLDAPICTNCGAVTRRNGTCYICDFCGTSNGCS